MYLDHDASDKRDASATLEAPTVEEAVGNRLDPTLPEATIVIPLYTGKAPNDEVTMHWDGETAAGSTTDSIRVTENNQGRVIRFHVDEEYIALNDGHEVDVWYHVARAGGGSDDSFTLTLEVGEQAGEPGPVDPPEIDEVQDGVLNLANVPDVGVTATVPPYDLMKRFDVVFISIITDGVEWEYGKEINDSSPVGQPVRILIPRAVLERMSGRAIKLRTTVIQGGDPALESRDLPLRVLAPVGDLPAVTVPLAEGDALDPEEVVTPTIQVVVKPYDGIAEGDVIRFTWTNASGAPAPFVDSKTADDPPRHDYVFEVPRAHVDQNIDKSATLSYTVVRGGAQPKPSTDLTLYIGAPFDAAATLDATGKNYILAEKLPSVIPEFGTYLREAKFGTAPYTYQSSDETVASVDNTGNPGRVTARGNGTATITATDRNNQTHSYPITVMGVLRLFFVSPSASFSGAQAACNAMGLRVVTLDEMKAFWRNYYPSTGPVATYMGWLSYAFWTGTQLGAGTAYVYDLNGGSEQGNATGRNEADFMQVAGIFP